MPKFECESPLLNVLYACRNYTQRKRSRCNIPSDMESGLVDLRSSLCELVVLPAECLKKDLQQVNVPQVRVMANRPKSVLRVLKL